MELNMLSRQNQLSDMETYLNEVDTEVTMILQSLQWDRKHFLEQTTLVPCQHNANHRVPPDKVMEHERGCYLKSQGYVKSDRLLPSPFDPDASTLVKLSADHIAEIISNASRYQALFKKGPGCSGNQPLTLERLQSAYTADERRAIHSAVVAQVPSCHDLSDLDLLSTKDESKEAKPKSKLEILAELRDMKRRRTKYRVAAKTRNYSDVLRDVINTQMELYTQAQDDLSNRIKKEKEDITEEITEPNHISQATEDTYSKVSHQYENRKRRHDDTYDEYNSARCSKTQERHRATACKTYEYKDNISHASNSRRKDHTSNKRDNRHAKYSRANIDRNKYDRDYERRKRQRDKNGDNRRETDRLNARNYIRKEKGEFSTYGSSGSAYKKASEGKHYSSDGSYSNIQRETQKHVQHQHSELRREYNAVKSNVEKHSYHDNSYSSDDSESDYTEKSEIHDKSKKTHHSYKAHYSKVKKERETHVIDSHNSRNSHDQYKQDDCYQVDGTTVVKKEENISKDESYVSDKHSKGDKSSRPFHECEKSDKKYNTYEQRNKKSYRDNDEYKNKEYEKDDAYRRQKGSETEEQHEDKHHVHIKEELVSSEDDLDDRTDFSDSYHHNKGSSYKYYRDDKSYSDSHKGRAKDSEHNNSRRRYEDSSDRHRKKR